ncbi:MAG: transposase [Candidatus Binatota bacterium]
MSFIRRIKRNGKVYLAEVENHWEKGTCVQRHIRYIGKEVDGKTVLSVSMSDIEIEQVKVYGPLLLLNHLASELDLAGLLGQYGKEILSMVYAHCLDYKSINQMPSWFERTDLNMLLDFDGLTEKRLLNALDSLEGHNPDALQSGIFEAVKRHYSLSNTGVVYDVTNTYLYGKRCPLGKLGYDKEGVKGRPLIQIGLGVTQGEGIPIFHKVFDGNIHDSRTLQDLATSFREYPLPPGILIYDRGITSGRNLKDIKALGWDTLCGVPLNAALKRFWRTILAKARLIHLNNRVRLKKTIFYVLGRPHRIDGVRGKLVLCFNDQQQRDLRESRYDAICHAQKLLQEGRKIKPGLERYFDKQGRPIAQKLKEGEAFDGYSSVFCTRPLANEELVRLYFDKDLIEKAFRSLKGIANLQPVRHWLYQRVSAHVFICYLAYLLLSLLKFRLRGIGISAEEALGELETMYKVYLRDSKNIFKISRVVTLSKRQELILKTVDKKLLKS